MEETDKLHSPRKREEEVESRRTDEPVSGTKDPSRLTDENYTKSRELWKLYAKGKITLAQLNEGLAIQPSGKEESTLDKVKDLFNAKEL